MKYELCVGQCRAHRRGRRGAVHLLLGHHACCTEIGWPGPSKEMAYLQVGRYLLTEYLVEKPVKTTCGFVICAATFAAAGPGGPPSPHPIAGTQINNIDCMQGHAPTFHPRRAYMRLCIHPISGLRRAHPNLETLTLALHPVPPPGAQNRHQEWEKQALGPGAYRHHYRPHRHRTPLRPKPSWRTPPGTTDSPRPHSLCPPSLPNLTRLCANTILHPFSGRLFASCSFILSPFSPPSTHDVLPSFPKPSIASGPLPLLRARYDQTNHPLSRSHPGIV